MSLQKLVEKFDTVDKVNMELKRVQSIKCRLKKMQSRPDNKSQLEKTLVYEDNLKQVRQVLRPIDKKVPDFTQSDIDLLDYDKTVRAIRSIQSKKTLTKYVGKVPEQNDEYVNACKVEQMLLDHRQKLTPIDNNLLKKEQIATIIETIQTSQNLSNEQIVTMLQNLI